MDSELLASLRDYLRAKPDAKMLGQDESDRLRVVVAKHYGFSDDGAWWWEEPPAGSAVSFAYGGPEGLDLLLEVLPKRTESLWLFVTDDDPPPWPCICGTASALVDMLRDQRFFEYFIVDPGLKWIVFDTHHNSLVALGLTVQCARHGRNDR